MQNQAIFAHICYNKIMKSIATKNGIKKLLNTPVEVEVFDIINSTNLYAKNLIKNGKTDEFLVVAREQSGGRGRFERKFYSPKDCGIYFSLVLHPASMQELAMLTPLCGLATVNAIKKALDKDTKIKWVNDIYFEGKKCTGILCEAVSVGGKIQSVVLGIGVNLYEKDGGADEEIKDIVSFVGDGSEDLSNRLIAGIVNEIYAMHKNFDKTQIVADYKKHSFLIGKEVEVCALNQPMRQATAIDIDENCNLVVKYVDGSVQSLNAGEVRIKF